MLTDVFRLLEAKQAELETKKEYADALRNYWASRIELENAVGAKLDFEPAAPAKNSKVDQPKMNQEHHGG